MNAYQRVVSDVQRSLPKTATPQQRAQAMKKAAAIWRGEARAERENPDGKQMLKLGLLAAGAAYVIYRTVTQAKTVAPAGSSTTVKLP